MPHADAHASTAFSGLRATRLGPGGFCLLGAGVALAGGGAVAAIELSAGRSGAGALFLMLAALALGVAGAAYYRAAAASGAPALRLTCRGDRAAAWGAAAFAGALAFAAPPWLALLAAALGALGKAGSAWAPAIPGEAGPWPDPFRAASLAGRLVAGAGAVLALAGGTGAADPLAAVILACSLAWARADLLLMRA